MVKQTIKIYARVRPSKKNTAVYSVNTDDQTSDSLEFLVPRDAADGFVNNKRECYRFRFQKVFDQAAKQEEIFENIAKPVADSVLAGYNGTIFAYGQTGSGKTFTITGGAERYSDRGIVPRTLSYLYERLSQDSSMVHTVHISYLEIYNETGYDLLDSRNEASQLEDLPKVVIMEDPNQNIHLKNLLLLQSSNEEEALNLLFLGDTNRVIAETPMNQASTRSHCIFTVHLCRREPGSTTVRRSKLHLVDLAGSERASKTGLNGQLLTEAKYINLSLHYLEQVIIALSERNRTHIPYRNSMLTSVLRDSLGGNCMTTMIATISVDKRNLDESISTCHFAQRVAVIKNEAILNEELDPALLIARLKQENQCLKEELALLTTEERDDVLTADEIQKLEELVRQFLDDPDMDATLLPGPDMRKIKHCFLILKKMYLGGNRGSDAQVSPATEVKDKQIPDHRMAAEITRLEEMLLQRDNEISILVKFLKKEKQAAQEANAKLASIQNGPNLVAKSSSGSTTPLLKEGGGGGRAIQYMKRGLELSMGKKEAFEIYKRDHKGPEATEISKNLLKKRSAEALKLGEQLKEAMSKINGMKKQLELWQRQRAARAVMGNNMEVVEEEDPVEENLRKDIKQEKKIYRDVVGQLRALRTEIEYLQLSLERSEVKLETDFLKWWNQEASDMQESEAAGGDRTGSPCGTVQPTSAAAAAAASSEAPGPSSAARPQPAARSSSPTEMLPGRNSPVSPPASWDQRTPDFPPPSKQRVTTSYTPFTPYPLTGNPQIDPDIMAFQRARDEVYYTIMNRNNTQNP